MKDVYFHIGMPKTASTYIQETIRLNADTLEKHGYHYPTSKLEYDGSQRLFCFSFIAQRYPEIVARDFFRIPEKVIRTRYRSIIEDSQCETILLSNERLASNLSVVDFTALRAFFSFCNVKIVILLRRQDYYVEAMYREALRSFNIRSSNIFEFLARYFEPSFLDYGRLLESWAERFGERNIIVVPYEKPVPSGSGTGDAIDWFFDAVNLDPQVTATLVRPRGARAENKRLKREFLKFLEMMKGDDIEAGCCTELQNLVQQLSFSQSYDEDADNRGFFTPGFRRDFLEKYRASNEWVARKYLPDSKRGLFSCGAESGADVDDDRPLSSAEFMAIAMNVISSRHGGASGPARNEDLMRKLKFALYRMIWPNR